MDKNAEYLRLLQEKNRLKKLMNAKSKEELMNEELERGFSTHFRGAHAPKEEKAPIQAKVPLKPFGVIGKFPLADGWGKDQSEVHSAQDDTTTIKTTKMRFQSKIASPTDSSVWHGSRTTTKAHSLQSPQEQYYAQDVGRGDDNEIEQSDYETDFDDYASEAEKEDLNNYRKNWNHKDSSHQFATHFESSTNVNEEDDDQDEAAGNERTKSSTAGAHEIHSVNYAGFDGTEGLRIQGSPSKCEEHVPVGSDSMSGVGVEPTSDVQTQSKVAAKSIVVDSLDASLQVRVKGLTAEQKRKLLLLLESDEAAEAGAGEVQRKDGAEGGVEGHVKDPENANNRHIPAEGGGGGMSVLSPQRHAKSSTAGTATRGALPASPARSTDAVAEATQESSASVRMGVSNSDVSVNGGIPVQFRVRIVSSWVPKVKFVSLGGIRVRLCVPACCGAVGGEATITCDILPYLSCKLTSGLVPLQAASEAVRTLPALLNHSHSILGGGAPGGTFVRRPSSAYRGGSGGGLTASHQQAQAVWKGPLGTEGPLEFIFEGTLPDYMGLPSGAEVMHRLELLVWNSYAPPLNSSSARDIDVYVGSKCVWSGELEQEQPQEPRGAAELLDSLSTVNKGEPAPSLRLRPWVATSAPVGAPVPKPSFNDPISLSQRSTNEGAMSEMQQVSSSKSPARKSLIPVFEGLYAKEGVGSNFSGVREEEEGRSPVRRSVAGSGSRAAVPDWLADSGGSSKPRASASRLNVQGQVQAEAVPAQRAAESEGVTKTKRPTRYRGSASGQGAEAELEARSAGKAAAVGSPPRETDGQQGSTYQPTLIGISGDSGGGGMNGVGSSISGSPRKVEKEKRRRIRDSETHFGKKEVSVAHEILDQSMSRNKGAVGAERVDAGRAQEEEEGLDAEGGNAPSPQRQQSERRRASRRDRKHLLKDLNAPSSVLSDAPGASGARAAVDMDVNLGFSPSYSGDRRKEREMELKKSLDSVAFNDKFNLGRLSVSKLPTAEELESSFGHLPLSNPLLEGAAEDEEDQESQLLARMSAVRSSATKIPSAVAAPADDVEDSLDHRGRPSRAASGGAGDGAAAGNGYNPSFGAGTGVVGSPRKQLRLVADSTPERSGSQAPLVDNKTASAASAASAASPGGRSVARSNSRSDLAGSKVSADRDGGGGGGGRTARIGLVQNQIQSTIAGLAEIMSNMKVSSAAAAVAAVAAGPESNRDLLESPSNTARKSASSRSVSKSTVSTPSAKDAAISDTKKCFPVGRKLEVNILSNWGDAHYIGANGIELYDKEGRLLILRNNGTAEYAGDHENVAAVITSIKAFPSDLGALGKTDDPRRAANLLDGVNFTKNDLHMWLAPLRSMVEEPEPRPSERALDAGCIASICMDFDAPVALSLVRIFNFNKSRTHNQRGIRNCRLLLDGREIYQG
jgi:hypothetical protein